MDVQTLKSSDKVLEFRTAGGTTLYGIYDNDSATFGDAISSFLNNYSHSGKRLEEFSFYLEPLKKYVTEMDLDKKISMYNIPKISIIKQSFNKENKWTIKENKELEQKYENIDINVRIYQKDENYEKNFEIHYESDFNINVHHCINVNKLKNIICKKKNLSADEYDLCYDYRLMSCGNMSNYHVKNKDKVHLIKKSDAELELERSQGICIKYNDKTITCGINIWSKVLDIKVKILEKENIQISNQCLKYKDKILEDNAYVSKYGIKECSELLLTVITSENAYFKIFANTLANDTYTLDVNNNMTIYDLKKLICNVEHTPIEEQRLIFAGRQLSDEHKISDYNIISGSTILMVLRLRGGMFHETSGKNGGFSQLKSSLFRITCK
jgi:Ubiquitin family.